MHRAHDGSSARRHDGTTWNPFTVLGRIVLGRIVPGRVAYLSTHTAVCLLRVRKRTSNVRYHSPRSVHLCLVRSGLGRAVGQLLCQRIDLCELVGEARGVEEWSKIEPVVIW